MKVICISGKAGHGKDTTAELIKEELEKKDCGKVLIAHYADLVKYICKTFFEWDGQKDEKGRHLLQYVGTDIVRKKRPDFWVGFIADVLELFYSNWDYVLIPDCRFENEINFLKNKDYFSVTHLRVCRGNYESGLTHEQLSHESEVALDDVIPDFIILNKGTVDDLRDGVVCFLLSKLKDWGMG